MVNFPILNAGLKYINGLKLSFNTVTLLDVAEGQCRDSSNVNDIEVEALTINAATTGAGGLDQGSLANSTLYAVHAVDDSSRSNAGSAILSLSADEPLLPFGYDMNRRIGWVLTDGSAEILPFFQNGTASTRRITYDTLIEVLNAGNDTSFTDVDCSAEVPSTALAAVLQCSFTPATASTNQLKLRRDGSSSTNGSVQANGTVNAVVSEAQLWVPVDSAGVFEYLVSNGSDAVTINVSSYDDEL